jgi:gamma-glutamyl-gamma-aminobutyrate hydrolase PuuD
LLQYLKKIGRIIILMSLTLAEIPHIKIGVLQARKDPRTGLAEQQRVRRSFAQTRAVRVEPVFIDTLDPRGIRQGRSLGKLLDQFDGFAATGTSDMDEFHRDTNTPEGRLREQYHGETMPVIQGAVEREMPFLGVCFGSHALAVAMVGEHTVNHVPKHEEFGTVNFDTCWAARFAFW